MISVINELVGGLKSSYIGAKKGGFNILNISRELYKNLDFWEVFNKPWLQAAIDRRDIFFAASDPTNLGNIFRSFKNVPTESLTSPEAIADYLATLDDAEIIKEMTFYGREIQLLSQNNYIFNTVNKKFEIP